MAALKRVMRLLILLILVGYTALIVLALMSDRVIFQPHPSSYRFPDFQHPRSADVKSAMIQSGGNKIAAVYLPNPSARYTLLFNHGNAEDIGDNMPVLEELRKAGFAVFAYDYRGYGLSQGVSSEKSLYEDAESAYTYLVDKLGVPSDQVIVFGRSLGCAAATRLAAHHSVAGLILESPFVSAFRVLTRVRLLPWDKFDNGTQIKNVHCPVLVIHGRCDRVVPWRHGLAIYRLANEPKRYLWVDNAGHNDVLLVAWTRYFAVLKDFATLVCTRQQVCTDVARH